MSVILTATKKSVCQKSSKPKKQPKKTSTPPSQQKFDPTPPVSSPKTTVWHWALDRKPTTVMFEKATGAVWCNGAILNTEMAFAEGDGGVIEFVLEVKDGIVHFAKIVRISTGTKKDGMAYQLYVDGISILEHTDKPLSLPAPEAIGAAACSPPAYYEDPVPAYEKKTK